MFIIKQQIGIQFQNIIQRHSEETGNGHTRHKQNNGGKAKGRVQETKQSQNQGEHRDTS